MSKQIEATRSGLIAIKSLLGRDPCVHAKVAIEMIDAMLAERPAQQEPVAHINSNGVVHAAGYPWGDKEVLRPLVYGDTTPQPPAQRTWVDPNDKTQKQYLPHIGEPVLFCHGGKTYTGKHTGGSFQSEVTSQYFNTWECHWMYLPSAPQPPAQQEARIAQLEAELMRMQGRELKLQFALAEQPAPVQRKATTYAERFTHAVSVLCGAQPPADMVAEWIANVDVNGEHRLQSWVLCQAATPFWAQGIVVLDAAHVLANDPEEGEGHEDAPQPPAQPLTDEQLNDLADRCTPNTETGALNYRVFARAIEAAHGITKGEHMTERQLIEDLLSALEYHTEQTRPIQFSKVAIEAAREHLRKPEQPAQQEPVAQWQKKHPTKTEGKWENTNGPDAKWWRDNSEGWEIRALYTSPPEQQPAQQEPVAHINSNGVVHAAGYPWGDKEVLRPLVYGDTTPQPPAQPLTDDKYEAIVEDLADWGRYVEVDTAHQSLEKHVREVLAAHGITKGEKA